MIAMRRQGSFHDKYRFRDPLDARRSSPPRDSGAGHGASDPEHLP
jgi:hypothetical protein